MPNHACGARAPSADLPLTSHSASHRLKCTEGIDWDGAGMERRVSEQEKQATSWWKTQIFSVAFIFSVMIILLLLLKPWRRHGPLSPVPS